MSAHNLDQIVKRVVQNRFSEGSIEAVEMSHDVDEDGDRVVKIIIFCGKSFGPSDEKRMLGFVRHIRSELADVQNDEFPMIEFVSGTDVAKMRREFA